MDLAAIWYGYLEMPVDILTIFISAAAAVYWVKLFNRFSIGERRDEGWLWIFAAVLMALLLNLSTLVMGFANGRLPVGFDQVVVVDTNTIGFLSGFSRIVVAVSLAIGTYIIYGSMRGRGDVRFAFTAEPAAEAPSQSDPKYQLRSGFSYMVREGGTPGVSWQHYLRKEQKSVSAIEVFSDIVTHGTMGFCVTRRYPPKLRDDYGLMKTPMVWLSMDKQGAEVVHPSDLPELSHMIKDFIARGGDTVVLLDGLEYLVLHNGFDNIMMFLQGLDDVVVQHKARLIVSVDPSTMTEQQYHLLGRELTEYPPVPQ
jgi:hypothetical protein